MKNSAAQSLSFMQCHQMGHVVQTNNGPLAPIVDLQVSDAAIVQLERNGRPCTLPKLQPPMNGCDAGIAVSNHNHRIRLFLNRCEVGEHPLGHRLPTLSTRIRTPFHRWLCHGQRNLLRLFSRKVRCLAIAQLAECWCVMRRQSAALTDTLCRFLRPGQVTAGKPRRATVHQFLNGLGCRGSLSSATHGQMRVRPASGKPVGFVIRFPMPDEYQFPHGSTLPRCDEYEAIGCYGGCRGRGVCDHD